MSILADRDALPAGERFARIQDGRPFGGLRRGEFIKEAKRLRRPRASEIYMDVQNMLTGSAHD